MGAGRVLAFLAALLCLALGAWVVGVPLMAVVLYPLFRRPGPVRRRSLPRATMVLGTSLVLASAAALASGGRASPAALFIPGLLLLLWPRLPSAFGGEPWVPVKDSVLLRSSRLPFRWSVVSELKAGSDGAPRALSSYTGTLIVRPRAGTAHAVSTFLSISRASAEGRAVSLVRLSAEESQSGPLLLPLDSKDAASAFGEALEDQGRAADLVPDGRSLPDVLVVEAKSGLVSRLGAFRPTKKLQRGARLPVARRAMTPQPLMWELMAKVSSAAPIAPTDSYSFFLQSLRATRGVPLRERVEDIGGDSGSVTVKTLCGESVELSRPQLRALLSVYQ